MHQKSQSYDVQLLRYGVRPTDFVGILGHFCPFTTPSPPPPPPMCTINEDHMIYGSWNLRPVLYPELFWSRYTSLGSQPQTPKCSKVLISGATFHQRSLSQSPESDVLSYSECKIAKNFQCFAPGLHWERLTAQPQTPWLHNSFSPSYTRQKTDTPQKLLDMALKVWQTEIFIILGHFFPFQLTDKLENQNFKIEKTPGDIMILHICTI